jgi:hypothetical protein
MNQKAKQNIINILKGYLSTLRHTLKECQADENCSLKAYEDIVDKCQQTEYAIEEMENLK